jgi:hypothetical protein
MENLATIFFPEPQYTLVAALCYLLVFLTAYKRYNALIINYGGHDGPETARPWTTWLRYHCSAVIYACVYAIFLATLYQLFHQHPILVDMVRKMLPKESPFSADLETLSKDIGLLSPILAVGLLTWGAEKYRKTTAVDRKIRYFFQQMGSIPGAVSLTIRKLKRYELEFNPDECLGDVSEEMKKLMTLRVLVKDPKSLEHLYLRACHLFNTIDQWDRISSEFCQFQNAYRQSFENIRTRFEKVKRNAQRYYQLKLRLAGNAHLYAQISDRLSRTRFTSMYPKALTELRRDLKNDLKEVLENVYLFVACAVHSEGITAKKRNRLLESFGFRNADAERSKGNGVDPNDMVILALFLVFVIPLSALFAGVAGDQNVVQSMRYVVWSAMALFVGMACVAIPIMVKKVKDFSDKAFWVAIRPQKGHAWCAYLISGLSAGAVGIVVIFLLHFLDPGKSARPAVQSLIKTIPWGLVPLGISLALGYHLDRNTSDERNPIVTEALTTAAAGALAAVLATIINAGNIAGTILWSELVPQKIFGIIAASLLGGMIGTIVPKRYRRHATGAAKINLTDVDLKEVTQISLKKFTERAGNENITIDAKIADDIPLLRLDRAKIELAIDGLLSNALEFTPSGGVVIIHAGMHGQGGIRFSVRDNGIGMSPDKVKAVTGAQPELLHAAWQQIGEYPHANLLQVRAIVERHGGNFKLISRQWEGTEAVVELPPTLVCGQPEAAAPETIFEDVLEAEAA